MGYEFGDPCEEDVYLRHIKEEPDGLLKPKTHCGEYTIEHLRLNREGLRACRQKRRTLLGEMIAARRHIRQARQAPGGIVDATLIDRLENVVEIVRTQTFRPQVPNTQ